MKRATPALCRNLRRTHFLQFARLVVGREHKPFAHEEGIRRIAHKGKHDGRKLLCPPALHDLVEFCHMQIIAHFGKKFNSRRAVSPKKRPPLRQKGERSAEYGICEFFLKAFIRQERLVLCIGKETAFDDDGSIIRAFEHEIIARKRGMLLLRKCVELLLNAAGKPLPCGTAHAVKRLPAPARRVGRKIVLMHREHDRRLCALNDLSALFHIAPLKAFGRMPYRPPSSVLVSTTLNPASSKSSLSAYTTERLTSLSFTPVVLPTTPPSMPPCPASSTTVKRAGAE